MQRGRLEEAQRLFEGFASAGVPTAYACCGSRPARPRPVWWATRPCACSTRRPSGRCAGHEEAAAEPLGWSVIYAALYPGIMAHPPPADATQVRLAEARRRAPADPRPRRPSPRRPPGSRTRTPRPSAAGLTPPRGRSPPGSRWPVGRPRPRLRQPPPALGVRRGLAAVAARGRAHGPTRAGRDDGLRLQRLPAHGLRGARSPPATSPVPRPTPTGCSGCPATATTCTRRWPRQLEVDVLAGDLVGATQHGERFRASWEQAGRHHASTLAVGPYALALAHGLLGNDDRARGMADDRQAAGRRPARRRSTASRPAGHRPSTPGCSSTVAGPTRRWRPSRSTWTTRSGQRGPPPSGDRGTPRPGPRPARWHGAPGLEERLRPAAVATRDNPVAAALVRRAAALATGDLVSVADLATTFDRLGATYQRDRSTRLSR